jgi:small-conductance mechanosensitive channel
MNFLFMCKMGTVVIIRGQRTAVRRGTATRPSAYLHVRASAFALLLTVVSIFATLPAIVSGAPSPAAQSSAALPMPSAASARSAATPAQPASSPAARANGSPPQTNAANEAGAAKSQTASPEVDHRLIISYLGEVIGWYRHREVEETLAREPAETLFLADDRQMASDILKLAFESARAEAALLKVTANATEPTRDMAGLAGTSQLAGGGPLSGLSDLLTRRGHSQAEVDRAQAEVKDLETRLAGATKHNRESITRQLVNARGGLDLAQSRVDSLAAMIEFETGSTASGKESAGLEAQIDELEHSVPETAQQSKVQAPAASTAEAPSGASSGILGQAGNLTTLIRKGRTLADLIDATKALYATAERLRTPDLEALRTIDRQGLKLAAQAGSNDITTVKQNKAEFQKLTEQHKLISAALLPLAKQMVLLNLYAANLERWRGLVNQQFNIELRNLILRLAGLLILLAVIFTGAVVWRKLTFRYVQDVHRRHQLLQLRRLTVGVIVALVLIFDFANELGTLGTVMGFAAAGIALALQNVILSFAGYFYVSGRFGIRVGERVQISGVNGDVLEIGLFKMTLMEYAGENASSQPTGRVVVFPNSVVFQPNANFFKQAPGSNFTWNELRFTLAPECDYRLAEKRLIEVVNQVFARYRDQVQREYHNMERDLNVRLDMPRPHSRLQLGDAGIELVIRYPVQLYGAAQTADEVARRLVDAIKREPGLKLAASGTPSIQPDTAAQPAEPEGRAAADGTAQAGNDVRNDTRDAAQKPGPAAGESAPQPSGPSTKS